MRHFRLSVSGSAQFIAHHVEEQGVVGGENDLDGRGSAILVFSARSTAQEHAQRPRG